MKQTGISDYKELSKTYDSIRYSAESDLFIDHLRAEKLRELLKPSKDMTVLDVGTGTGSGLMFLHEHVSTIIGLDGTIEMLHQAQEKISSKNMKSPKLVHANALQIPIADNTLDAVISLNFIHLFTPAQNQKPFFKEMERVVKPGGIIIVEFDNALLGILVGIFRKYFVKDIGYNWPWDIYRLPSDTDVKKITGYSFPGTKKLYKINKRLARMHSVIASIFPFKYFGNKFLVRFEKR